MTIVETFEKLNEFFSQKSIFNIEDNYKDLFLISEDENHKIASIKCALTELQNSGVIRCTNVKDKEYWVLYKPLEAYDQTIEINYLLAAGISSVINNVCKIVGNDSDQCDPNNLRDRDLQNLVVIASKVSKENLKEFA